MSTRVALPAAFLVLTTLHGFAAPRPHGRSAHHSSAHRVSAANQFHFQPAAGPAKDRLERLRAGLRKQAPLPSVSVQPVRGQQRAAQARRGRVHQQDGLPVSQIGFVSATQIPAGGYLQGNVALSGDFDGDGNADMVSLVGDPASPGNFFIAVVLSNADGTFQTPVLTPAPGNDADPFVVGDVNGDGMDDIVVAHQPGFIPGTIGNPNASFSVLLSDGAGGFTAGNNYSITDHQLSGGGLVLNTTSGNLDAVFVDSSNPGNVWTVAGNGDGTFSLTPTSAALSAQVGFDVVLADFNGDGLIDITANDGVTGQQMVYLATDATTFAPGVALTTPGALYDACRTAVGDLTGDSRPEIVNANCGDNTITIYVNNGDGTFGAGTFYNAATNPTTQSFAFVYPAGVTVADVNGDGSGDVISSNGDSSDVTVLLGNGDGTVQVPTFGYTAGGELFSPAIVADFNGDGLADIMVPDNLFSLVYLKGYGDGTFRAAPDYYSPSADDGNPGGIDIATGDFNGDGLPDAVVGNCCDSVAGITVFLSQPDGSMQAGINYGTGGQFQHVAVADFDGDGNLDVAATSANTGHVQIFHGLGDGTFTLGNSYPTDVGSSFPQGIAVADFDQDGHPDLAVANTLGPDVGVLLNDGTGGFNPPVPYTTCSGARQVVAADVDGDGFPDLLTPLPACTGMSVFLNLGDGTFGPEDDFGVGISPQQVAVGDLNGDGKVDLAITMQTANQNGIAVALGNGDGTFQAVNVPPYPSTLQPNYFSPKPTAIQLVDLNADGFLDLVYTNSQFGTVGVMYGLGDGTFSEPAEYPDAQLSQSLALADVNADGALDVVSAGFKTSAVTVLLNNSGSKTVPDYAVASDPTTATITAGATGTFTITVTPHNFYNGTISFSCGSLPAHSTCTFGPTSLTPNGNGQVTTTLTIHTTAASASLRMPTGVNPHPDAPSLWASLGGIGVFGLMLAGDWKKKRNRRLGIILGLVVLGMMVTLGGCGGSSNGGGGGGGNAGTPPGLYHITVTATGTAGTTGGNTAAHNLNLDVTVQ